MNKMVIRTVVSLFVAGGLQIIGLTSSQAMESKRFNFPTAEKFEQLLVETKQDEELAGDITHSGLACTFFHEGLYKVQSLQCIAIPPHRDPLNYKMGSSAFDTITAYYGSLENEEFMSGAQTALILNLEQIKDYEIRLEINRGSVTYIDVPEGYNEEYNYYNVKNDPAAVTLIATKRD